MPGGECRVWAAPTSIQRRQAIPLIAATRLALERGEKRTTIEKRGLLGRSDDASMEPCEVATSALLPTLKGAAYVQVQTTH